MNRKITFFPSKKYEMKIMFPFLLLMIYFIISIIWDATKIFMLFTTGPFYMMCIFVVLFSFNIFAMTFLFYTNKEAVERH